MSIKQAIEALEELVEYAEEAGFDWSLDNARAALAALMPAEPVEVPPYIYGREAGENEKVWTEREVQMLVRERDMLAARVLDLMSATPHTEAVRMSEAEIGRLWEINVGEPTQKYPFTQKDWINFARAVEQATAARLGVKMGDV